MQDDGVEIQKTVPDYSDEEYGLSPALVREVDRALEAEERENIRFLVSELHEADLAELFNVLVAERREQLFHILDDQLDPEVLAHLNPEIREDVLEWLGTEKSAAAIAQLDTDDAVHVIEDLSEEEQQEILDAVPAEAREEIMDSLAYPESSSGRLMRKEFVTVPEFWTVGNTIDYLRSGPQLPEDFYVIFVVDPRYQPVGSLLLSRIMQHKRDVPIARFMSEDIKPFDTMTDQEEVARVFRKYALVEAPVVNEHGRLVGVITVDDVVDVIQEEGEEDFMRAGGVTAQDFHAGLFETVRARFPWLFINLITAFVSSRVISHFAGTIEHLVTLAVLMPIVASIGGNAGTQAVTVAVRAITTRELRSTNMNAMVRKEVLIALLNGACLAVVTFCAVFIWHREVKLAAVFALAIVLNLLMAGLAGALIPWLLTRLRADPAIASSVFLTMLTDTTGFFVFLGLAALVLVG